MRKTNLIKILSTLDESEFKKLGHFLSSAYFNTNQRVVELYNILKEYYPGFEDLEISNENIYRKIYGKDKVVIGTMYFLISEMESLLEKFLGLENINPLTLDLHSLEAMNRKGLHSAYGIKYKEIQKKIRDSDDSNDPMEINGMNSFILSRINFSHSKDDYGDLTKKDHFKKEWMDPSDELTKLFIRYAVKNIESLLNLKNTVNEKLEVPLQDEIVKYLEKNDRYKEDREIEVYYYQIKMLIGYEEKYYRKLKRILEEDHKSISNYLFNETITAMQNYCAYKVTQGVDMVREEFDIIKLHLKHQTPSQKKQFRIDVFYQTFMIAVALNEFEWADNFVKENVNNLEPQFKNNAFNYCNARIRFYYGEYDNALKYLSGIQTYSIIHIKAPVKMLQLMIYYELKLLSEAEDGAYSFRQFLRNDKLLTSGPKKCYSNFVTTILKLIKLEGNSQPSKVYDLRASIKNQKEYVVGGKWFNQKLDELEFKFSKKKKPAAG